MTKIEISRALVELGFVVLDHPTESSFGNAAFDITLSISSPLLSITTPGFDPNEVGHGLRESVLISHQAGDNDANKCGFACESQHTQKILIDHGVKFPVAAVGAGVDHWERVFPQADLAIPGKRFRFLHVSACRPADGIDLLLEAFGRVFDCDDDVSLILNLVGPPSNDLVALLERLRKANPVYPDVVIVDDHLADSSMKALYSGCQAFVAPSRSEGFGRLIAQALLTGLPVITTAWGGHMEYCNAESAWLVDYDSKRAGAAHEPVMAVEIEPKPHALDQALWTAFRASPSERFAKAWSGRKHLLENYTWKDVALRLAAFAESCMPEPVKPFRHSRIGLVTTWNVKCGIATYAEHLLALYSEERFFVFAARQEPRVRLDGPNVRRAWDPGKENNSLSEVADSLSRYSVDALIIQFHYGFFNHAELNAFIEATLARKIAVIVYLHSTVDGTEDNWRLKGFFGALKSSQRVLVHSLSDLDRLKDIGLVENVTLFPHGVLNKPRPSMALARSKVPLLASFGFCFKSKGLLELVQAVSLLKARGTSIRLRMLNADYGTTESIVLVQEIRLAIERLDLENEIEFCSDFLDDDVCLRLLKEADLFVNTYQATNESASGAVRYGLAAGVPVAVTPLEIFDDLGDAVFRMPGITPTAIAAGIEIALAHLQDNTVTAKRVENSARRWLADHDYAVLGARMIKIARALIPTRNKYGDTRGVLR